MAKRGLQFLPQRRATEPSPLGASIELGVGDILRMNRERRGQELQSVANQLRIRLAYLEAIEEGRYKDLPGSTYAVGFVRSYGDYLGLDGADIVRRFREEVARIHGRTRLIPPVIAADGTIPPAAMLLLSVVGIGIAYGAWYYFSSNDQSPVPVVQDVPARMIDAPDGAAGAQPEAAPAPAAGSSQGGSSAPADGSAAATESGPGSPGNSPSNLSTIMAPEPTTGSPEDETFVPPPPPTVLPAAPPTIETPETPAVSTPPVAETPAAPAPTAEAPAAPPAPAEETAPPTPNQTADTTIQAPSAPDTATPPAAPTAPSVTESTVPPLAADGTATPPTTASPPTEAPTVDTGSAETAPPPQTAATDSTIPSAPALPTPEAEATETPPATAAIPSGTRIRINARLDTWVKIVDHNGRTVLNRVLTSGEGYDVPDEAGLKMITGNAGGMDILVDGVAIAPLGEPGKVRRDVELDPEKLKAGTAIPQ
jgi:cytoskeleton protein RodZ